MSNAQIVSADSLYRGTLTGKLVPCPGEAHDPSVGGMIDHCSTCSPRWGQVEERLWRIEDARAMKGGLVDISFAPDSVFEEWERLGVLKEVEIENKGKGKGRRWTRILVLNPA